MVASTASLNIEVKSNGVDTAEKGLKDLTTAGKKTEAQVMSLQKSMKRAQMQAANTGGAFKIQNNQIQNAAFQIQDLVTQLEMGTSASRALSQQLPQLLGGFGAIGAVSGVVAGLAFAIGGPLVNSMFAGANAAEDLDKALDELQDTISVTKDGTILLTEEFAALAGKSREVAEVQLRARLITAAEASNAAFLTLSDTLSDLDVKIVKTGNAARGNAGRIRRMAEEYGITSRQVKELKGLIDTAISSKSLADVQALRDRVTDLGISTAKDNEKFIAFAQAVNVATAAMERQDDIASLLTQTINDQETAISNNTEAGIRASEERAKQIDKDLSEIERYERGLTSHFDRLEKDRAADMERQERDAARQQILWKTRLNGLTSFTQGSLSIIEGGAKEGSAIQKAAFLANQAVAIPKMIVDTEAAATAALAFGGPVAGAALSAVVRGLGYASIGIAAGQSIGTVAGRQQGGQARDGQPIVVGERGPELLVPQSNGTIVNNNQMRNGGSDNTNVTIVNQTTGRIDSVQQQQLSRNDIVLIIQETVPTEISNTNSRTSKALRANTSSNRRLT